MGKKKGKKSLPPSPPEPQLTPGGLLLIPPSQIRFQYSRISQTFSGCGRTVSSTFDSIVSGLAVVENIPPITVIKGTPDEDNVTWYFSLNNRRLYVFKKLEKAGLLDVVGVRVRGCKSEKERERYTVGNTVLEARFMNERKKGGGNGGKEAKREEVIEAEEEDDGKEEEEGAGNDDGAKDDGEEAADDVSLDSSLSSSSGDEGGYTNPFAALT